MSRRRSEGGLDEAVNMDVMMDNMTDVVGTLLMVLIIVQLKVNSTINNIQSALPEVTQQQVQEVQAEAAEQKKKVELATADLQTKPPTDEQLAAQIRSTQDKIQHFETTLSQPNIKLMDLKKLEKQLAEKRQQLEAEKLALAKLIDEREKLKGLLDDTPVAVIPPAKIVRMPAARQIPEGAEIIRVLCAGGRVYVVDSAQMKKITLYAMSKARVSLIHTRGPVTAGKDTNIYDHLKTTTLLNKQKLDNHSFELNFPLVKTSERLRMEIKPKPTTGETPTDFAASRSQFSTFLRVMKRNPKGVVWFMVYKDSMETYLAAREVCDEVGVPAGWEMTNSPWLTEVFYDFKVNVIEQPPKPVAGGVVIPPPMKTID